MSGLDGVNLLQSSSYAAVFWICDESSVDNTPVFGYPWGEPAQCQHFLFFPPCSQHWVGQGWARSWEGTQPGQKAQTDQRDTLCHVMSCLPIKIEWRDIWGGSIYVGSDWISFYLWEVASDCLCIIFFPSFYFAYEAMLISTHGFSCFSSSYSLPCSAGGLASKWFCGV